jgi:ornithine cyclodeaminase
LPFRSVLRLKKQCYNRSVWSEKKWRDLVASDGQAFRETRIETKLSKKDFSRQQSHRIIDKGCSMRRSLACFSKMLLLSEKDVRQCLSMKDCIDVNRRALASLVPGGGGEVPKRLLLPYSKMSKDAQDWTLFKPAAFYGNDNNVQMGMKLVSVRAENPSRGLPLVPATVLLSDAPTGQVQALLAGTYLTGARTAAGSAVATQLVGSQKNMHHLVVFGAGLQAECHIEAILCVQPSISRITVVNRTSKRASDLLESLPSGIIGNMVLLDNKEGIKQALADADVVVTCTNSATPLFDGSWLPPGCHVNGVGSYTPEMQELDETSVNRSRILVDTLESLDVGDLKHILRESHPWKLLGEVINDPTWLHNENDSSLDCTLFKSTGTAMQDVMTASLVVDRARELGLGTIVDMS